MMIRTLAQARYDMNKQEKWKDHYSNRAREEKWRARSVYKLEEIDRKHTIIRKGFRVLDLGCCPGSWSQYCLKKVGKRGEVVGLDIKVPDRISAENFRFIKTDILSLETGWLLREVGETDIVLSDMAPNTTGISLVDVSQSLALAEKALETALAVLKERGHFLCKVFEGEDFKDFRAKAASCFGQVKILRPAAVRKRSREVYVLGLELVRKSTGHAVDTYCHS
jgi:23S rRNA (uridine2552-2'-O)-methyltransferase